jgi:acyl-CoA thioester hydrolase
MDRSLFTHRHPISVRNYEVDWQGIVHNGNYLLYCEVGRIEYLKHIGAVIDLTAINKQSRVVLVRNEIDYHLPAVLNDELIIWTRIAWVRNSSFAMEGLIERASTREILAENIAIHAWLHPSEPHAITVPDDFRALVLKYEGTKCEFLKHSTPE